MNDIEILREGARLMRERATAATASPTEKPHGWAGFGTADGWSAIYGGPVEDGYRMSTVFSTAEGCNACQGATDADVQHIAGWHPAVALAVAAWLDDIATGATAYNGGRVYEPNALAVARAYLGEVAS